MGVGVEADRVELLDVGDDGEEEEDEAEVDEAGDWPACPNCRAA